ncbi:MAG: aminotransferase class I/II-fold pyridoxal phosphate-dependent enzyme [Acidimicrobiia bacterium]|nr:aminotransferase class I/II-fold pyridoxal phosphate-dependent enzyme [Acidimicrobiia bacterium]NNF10122.1 aminotransferase class I/II-fold pyridoxal phosphate-dependent enzyme [Acidimicrobiia bacterium]NNL70668.1 aminotransferase class I/II-fold pyridoxal phosphate-dependent enzyme [Acidimicrobiia bacterium]
MSVPDPNPMTPGAIAASPERMRRLFDGAEDVLPLWIAEPYLGLAPEIETALQERAAAGWYGYEVRPETALGAFWSWMGTRHGWDGAELSTTVSPSVGTSIGVLIDRFTEPGQGVILQPPVFTDFKPLINRAGRTVVRNALQLTEAGYRMDLDDLAAKASVPENRLMILCNPHNPVGRVWSTEELSSVARICAEHDVVVVADEIHADLALPGFRFTPFARAAGGSGVAWAALHGPIKTFGLAGVCDTLLITDNTSIADAFRTESSRLHLTRNNVFNIAALEAAYTTDGSWLDGLLEQVAANVTLLRNGLPDGIGLIPPEGTYLAWLDFRRLGMDVPELAAWLASSAKLALSPGHWFGREGAGFARMTIAAPTRWIEEAVARVGRAVRRRPG